MANVLIDNAVMADARTLAAQLAAKQEASLMGQYVKADGTVAFTGEITVPTATSNPRAVNKGQMDAAIAAVSAGGSADTVSVKGDYGAVGDGVADDTAEFQAAIASGKCLFIPEGTYKISSDLRIMTTRQSLIGVGWASKLVMTNSAKLILGEAIGSSTDGTPKSGTKPTNIMLRDLWVQGQNNHVGAVIQIDFADAVKMFNVLSTLSQYTNGSGAYAIGLKIRWCQWLDCVACYFMGNKYGIHMSIENRSPFNEGHFTFVGGQINCEKTVELGERCANVCQEMLRNGTGPIHTVFYNCHLLNNTNAWNGSTLTSQVRANKSGMLFKTAVANTFYTNVKPVTFNDCEFESCGQVIDFGSESLADAGGYCEIDKIECYNAEHIGYGLAPSKTAIFLGTYHCDLDLTAGNSPFDGVAILPSYGPKGVVGDTALPAGVMDANHYPIAMRDASGRRSMRFGRQVVLAGAQHVDVTHTMDYTPDLVLVTPSWRTDWNITSLGATTFRIEFGTAPSGNSNVYFWCLRGPNWLQNTTPAGTLLTQVKTANYTLVRADNGRTVTHNATTAHTFTIPASTTLGQDFSCRIANVNTGVLTLTVAGVGDVTLAQNETREVFYSGSTGIIAYASAARAISAMS